MPRPPRGAPHRETPYWPEIDGLRAIAVASVFVFHLDIGWLRGGFVGVDVFFAISGFLITDQILSEIRRGTFSLPRFYQKRIARIAPAAFLVLAATMIASSLIYSAQDFASVGAAALAAALSFINFKLLLQGSYFQISLDAQPLIHYWSLTIEEQFYLLFPIGLYMASRSPRYLLGGILVACGSSLAACMVMTPHVPVAAFYLLPTRGWELLAGAALAIARREHPRIWARHAKLCSASGLVAITASVLAIGERGFPGWIALLPVGGAVLVLAAAGHLRSGWVYKGLAHPAMTFIGRRSFSLYLWHWPVFSLVAYRFYLSDVRTVTLLRIALSVGLAALAYEAVEKPMRRRLCASPRLVPTLAAFLSAAAALGVAGYAVRSAFYLSAEPRTVATGGIAVNGKGERWVVLIGDSQGAMYGYELAALAPSLGFRLNILSAAAGNELPDEPETLWPEVARFLGDRRPDVIVVAQAWSSKLGEDGEAHLARVASTLEGRASRILVLTQPPEPPADATRQAILAGARPPFFEGAAQTSRRLRADAMIDRIASDDLHVVHVADLFLNDDAIRLIGPDGRSFYQDPAHLAQPGTEIVRPRLEGALRNALDAASRLRSARMRTGPAEPPD